MQKNKQHQNKSHNIKKQWLEFGEITLSTLASFAPFDFQELQGFVPRVLPKGLQHLRGENLWVWHSLPDLHQICNKSSKCICFILEALLQQPCIAMLSYVGCQCAWHLLGQWSQVSFCSKEQLLKLRRYWNSPAAQVPTSMQSCWEPKPQPSSRTRMDQDGPWHVWEAPSSIYLNSIVKDLHLFHERSHWYWYRNIFYLSWMMDALHLHDRQALRIWQLMAVHYLDIGWCKTVQSRRGVTLHLSTCMFKPVHTFLCPCLRISFVHLRSLSELFWTRFHVKRSATEHISTSWSLKMFGHMTVSSRKLRGLLLQHHLLEGIWSLLWSSLSRWLVAEIQQ